MTYSIILDTNIIFNDFYFKSADMKKLLKYARQESIDLCLTMFNYIETVNPSYEKGDLGDGMLSEYSTTDIIIQANITYLINDDKFIDYVEMDSEYI